MTLNIEYRLDLIIYEATNTGKELDQVKKQLRKLRDQ